MIFQQILLQIFHKFQSERSISAAYHLLKGKRSGQTIQDVGIFQLYPFFGLLPKLTRSIFDEEVNKLISIEMLHILEYGNFTLNPSVEFKELLYFDGWHYRGNEHSFFSRLTLVVQTLSHHKEGEMNFSPVVKDESTQQWVRAFLHWGHYQSGDMQKQLYEEIHRTINQSTMSEIQKQLILSRLSGYGIPGLTWQQLAHEFQLASIDVHLQYISALHIWLNKIAESEQSPLLQKLAQGIRVDAVLTESANQTALLFQRGYSIDQISYMRELKVSTIEDHLVELAMNEPAFPYEKFISDEDIQKVHQSVQRLQTKKLKTLHQVLEQLSYFQLRLALAKGVH